MVQLLASFKFTTSFVVWGIFLMIGLPIVIPVSLLSHWLIRRYLVASLVGPAVLLVAFVQQMWPSRWELTDQDYVVGFCVVGMSFVTSLLIGLPFKKSRRNRQSKPPVSVADAVPQSSGDTKPPA